MCAPAVAVIFSSIGEVEIFSRNQKCSQKILDFPSFGGVGRSIDLLDEQLILLGNSTLGKDKRFDYIKIHHPRKGLLGMRYSKEISPEGVGFSNPRWHTSHAYGNRLLAIGGEFNTEAQLSDTVWLGTALQQNGEIFSRFSIGACKVKLETGVFLLIGGRESMTGEEMNTVLRLNIKNETVEELPPIKRKRAFHSCEIFEKRILITGGKEGDNMVVDEVYDSETYVSSILDESSSLQRNHHQLLRLEEKIFAFGGVLKNGSQTAEVQWFDFAIGQTGKWMHHDHSLLSKDTTNLAVTSFPQSAIDCHGTCSCGHMGNLSDSRIIGGREAKVVLLLHIVPNLTISSGTGLPLDCSIDHGGGKTSPRIHLHQLQWDSGKMKICQRTLILSRSEAHGW